MSRIAKELRKLNWQQLERLEKDTRESIMKAGAWRNIPPDKERPKFVPLHKAKKLLACILTIKKEKKK